jgi:UPF0755 protein
MYNSTYKVKLLGEPIMKKPILIILMLSICLAFLSCGSKKEVPKTESVVESSSMQSEIQSEIDSSEPIASNPFSSKFNASSKVTSSKPPLKSQSSLKPPLKSQSSSKTPLTSQSSSSIPIKTVVNVTIPEGFSIFDIGKRLEDNGVCSQADFLSAVNLFNYSSYSVTNSIDNVSKRYYKLEGYLYPSTYQFYKNTKPDDVIAKIIKTTQSKIAPNYSYPGMTIDQIITIASLIQEEAARYDDMVNVSAVIHNRLKIKMLLQLDCTTVYLNNYFKTPEPYDTYKYFYSTKRETCPALPVGPICSPGASALKAAINPSDNPDYLFFKSDSLGNYSFSKTPIGSASSSSLSLAS